MVYEAGPAVRALESEGYDVALYDARFAKPVDVELLTDLIGQGVPVLTVEDHSVTGGFGAQVLETCNERRLSTDRIFRLGMPERWIYQDSRANQLAEAGIDADGIERRGREIMAEMHMAATPTPRLHGVAGRS